MPVIKEQLGEWVSEDFRRKLCSKLHSCILFFFPCFYRLNRCVQFWLSHFIYFIDLSPQSMHILKNTFFPNIGEIKASTCMVGESKKNRDTILPLSSFLVVKHTTIWFDVKIHLKQIPTNRGRVGARLIIRTMKPTVMFSIQSLHWWFSIAPCWSVNMTWGLLNPPPGC